MTSLTAWIYSRRSKQSRRRCRVRKITVRVLLQRVWRRRASRVCWRTTRATSVRRSLKSLWPRIRTLVICFTLMFSHCTRKSLMNSRMSYRSRRSASHGREEKSKCWLSTRGHSWQSRTWALLRHRRNRNKIVDQMPRRVVLRWVHRTLWWHLHRQVPDRNRSSLISSLMIRCRRQMKTQLNPETLLRIPPNHRNQRNHRRL